MIIGFVGSGNMAAAMARGWSGEGETMLFSDGGSGRAQALADELGGQVASNAEIASKADLVILAVKPAAMERVAPDLSGAKVVVSLLGATPLSAVAAAFPAAEAHRVMPNVAVEIRRGVLCVSGPPTPAVRDKLALLGHVVELRDEDFDAATAVMGCAPAYFALAAEAIVAAGADAGLDPELARELVAETAAGTGELLRAHDPAAVQRAVASPGGSTEAGLQALEQQGAREAFEAAVRASLERMKR